MHHSNRLGSVLALTLCTVTGASAQTLGFTDEQAGTFLDISSTGTRLSLGDDDVAEIESTVGNAVFPSGRVVIGQNGAVGFNPPENELGPVNTPLPSDSAFGGGQGAMVYWDDFGPSDKVGDVFWQEIPRFGGPILVVQWNELAFADSDDRASFQLQVFADPDPELVYAQFLYTDIEDPRAGGGASASIGYQDGDAGFNDAKWGTDTPNRVSNGTVLSLTGTIPEPAPALLMLVVAAFWRRRGRRAA